MRWEGGRRSGDVEDRRGLGPVGVGGGLSAGGVVIALIAYFVFGVDPREVLESGVGGAPAEQQQGVAGSPQDRQGQFVDTVFTSINDNWAQVFEREGRAYRKPTVVLYEQATSTGCGTGQAQMGPFYCPRDQKVYLDLTFFNELGSRFGAPGEFAQAYVIAHEVGHHVQTLTGTSAEVRRAQQAAGSQREANQYSVALELQADCYAGVWAKSYGGTGRLEDGDIQAALGAARAVGDDTLQKSTRGAVVPDSFTHGSSADRMRWFKAGYESGDAGACDTFR